ncbi:MAG: type II toxin-antitoxin system HigB family toxin [Bacteroidetes bacterium]|nr:type II toxin-antitoxin system HigB family toxin [Bacteroidota bacterium]
MVIVTKTRLNEYSRKHSVAAESLNYWYNVVHKANWKSFADVLNDFNSVDKVGNDRFVFNIKGNGFRLVAMIHFDIRTVCVRFIGTHAEYDKIKNISKI